MRRPGGVVHPYSTRPPPTALTVRQRHFIPEVQVFNPNERLWRRRDVLSAAQGC